MKALPFGQSVPTWRSCAATPSCLSSYDDRPAHFIAPWEYNTRSRQLAMERLVQAVELVSTMGNPTGERNGPLTVMGLGVRCNTLNTFK